ncbi:lipopolysaccharide-induced tumor necrosis factor-alpha factor homolog [Engraulis encrasicolus]|uniref:lipopolysaccharide-induced tumor necrosis factor-alpha factor homolog n=1 Tax=Engraulis encrasicolus TaxID=184585 RepID=UPI002FD56764
MRRFSNDPEMDSIVSKMNQLSCKRQQLHDRLTILNMLREFRSQTDQEVTDTAAEEAEVEAIQRQLDGISQQKRELLDMQDGLEIRQHTAFPRINTHDSTPDILKTSKEPPSPIDAMPPSIPAPKVFTDVEELPPYPAKARCPQCHSFITTEVTYTVGSVSWLVCSMSILLGCVAGCCLLPFCLQNFKDVHHKCPKCRTLLHTVKKL